MNIAVTQSAEGLSRRAFTVDDIRRMIDTGVLSEDEKIELVEGDLIVMAAKSFAHERVKSALLIAVARALPDDLTMGVEATLRLTNSTLLEPDIAVFPRTVFHNAASGFARLDPGQAVLVIEVAVSSLAYDRGLKAKLYARHRVQEFWVVDANEQVTWVHTGPQDEGWSSIAERGREDVLTAAPLPGFTFRLADIG